MKKLMNLLRGVVPVRAEGMFPERMMNLCAQHRADFWGVEWLDDNTITFFIRRRDLHQVKELGQKIGCTVAVGHGQGLPYFISRFRRRYAFWVGLGLSLACVGVLSNVVLSVEVEGNEQIPAAQILGELRRQGLRPGVYGPSLELKQLAQETLLELDGVAWMTINLHGTRAQVIVREEIARPELVEEEGWFDIIADADGIITELEVLQGQGRVAEGETVAAGDVLISGAVAMNPPKYSDLPVRYYQTHARGRVEARTWRTLEGRIPLTTQVKVYTGEKKVRFGLMFFGHSLDFYENSSIPWPNYDKIKTVYPLMGRDEAWFPLALVREDVSAYELREVPVDRDAAQDLLERELEADLKQLLGDRGFVSAQRFSAKVADGWLHVTLTAECREEIGVEREAS